MSATDTPNPLARLETRPPARPGYLGNAVDDGSEVTDGVDGVHAVSDTDIMSDSNVTIDLRNPPDQGEEPRPIVEMTGVAWSGDPAPSSLFQRTAATLKAQPLPYWLAIAASVAFGIIFGRLGVRHHENFGSWSFDMGIYDQAFWLTSKFGKTFLTVRGLEFWGHHVNLVAYLFAPAYWLGAGPRFLFVAQAVIIGLGGVPVYLMARDRLNNAWLGLGFSVGYLMYAPIQFISWANFHPEALVITPLLYAWWAARKKYWRTTIVFVLLALSTREDTALAVFMMGIVLIALSVFEFQKNRETVKWGGIIAILGAVWYAVATKIIIKHYNNGFDPFYIKFFYGDFGSTTVEVAKNMLLHPQRVISLAVEKDRLDFYKKLMLPLGGLPLLGLPFLLMGAPQMLASVTGSTPYARSIEYQYPSVMIASIIIAAIEGVGATLLTKPRRIVAVLWLLVSSYVTNVAWSPSPIGEKSYYFASYNPRVPALKRAVSMVPKDARVAATYQLLPHLSHRKYIYDWPNPWEPAYWGNDLDDATDKDPNVVHHWPAPHDPNTVDYLVIDRTQIGEQQQQLIARLIGNPGALSGDSNLIEQRPEFTIIFEQDGVVVAKRVRPGPPSTAK